jgi:hypothetical protein
MHQENHAITLRNAKKCKQMVGLPSVATPYHLPERGALSEAGKRRPLLSRIASFCFPFVLLPCRSSCSEPESTSSSWLLDDVVRVLRVSGRNILEPSWVSNSLSSSNNSPSAVSKSGGSTQPRGTTQGRATPMLAARFSQPGPARPVNFWQR